MGYPSMPEERGAPQPGAPPEGIPSPAPEMTVPTVSGKQSADGSDGQLPRIESATPRLPFGRATRQINDALAPEGSPSGFLAAAENTLLAASDDYTGRLGIEAISIARSRNATAVDRQDVRDATKRLRENATVDRQSWRLALAGFTGGGAISAIVALLFAPKPVTNIAYWYVSITVLGFLTFVLFSISYPHHRARDLRLPRFP